MSNESSAVFRPITAVWLIALPIMDTFAVMIRRIRSNQSPFLPGRDHIHHILLRVGFSTQQVLGILVALSAALAGIGVLGEIKKFPESFMFYGILTIFALYFIFTDKLHRKFVSEPDTR